MQQIFNFIFKNSNRMFFAVVMHFVFALLTISSIPIIESTMSHKKQAEYLNLKLKMMLWQLKTPD
jgi:hypothetical protein